MPSSHKSHQDQNKPKKYLNPSNNTSIESTQHGILRLPSESLTHITAGLDPASFFALALTNHALHEHVSQDNTWHIAFNYQYLGILPDSDGSSDPMMVHSARATLLLRRIHSTWRKEFLHRWMSSRRWETSRSSTISHTPHHSTISSMLMLPPSSVSQPQPSLLTSSLSYGIVSRSYPFTGKIVKGFLDARGALNGQGIGNPNAEFSPDVSAIALHNSPSPSVVRIAWGFLNGTVALTTGSKIMDLGKSAKFTHSRLVDAHPGVVTQLCFEPSGPVDGSDTSPIPTSAVVNSGKSFVSACARGTVKLWETRRMICLWTASVVPPPSPSRIVELTPPSIMRIAYDSVAGTVIAATDLGDLHVWAGLDVNKVVELDRLPPSTDALEGESVLRGSLQPKWYAKVPCPEPLKSSTEQLLEHAKPTGIVLQRTNPGSVPSQENQPPPVSFAIFYTDCPHFYRITVDFEAISGVTPLGTDSPHSMHITRFAGGSLGPITAFKADLVPSIQSPPPSTVTSPAPSAPLSHTSNPGLGALSILTSPRIIPDVKAFARSFILTGDALGAICVWEWDGEEKLVIDSGIDGEVENTFRWEAHDDGAVSAITLDGIVLVTGSAHGTINIYDSLNLNLLHCFASPTPRPRPGVANPADWERVSQLIVSGDILLASVASRVVAWRAAGKADKKGKSKAKGGSKARVNPSAKWQEHLELRRDIDDSQNDLFEEQTVTRAVLGRERDQMSMLETLGLDEVEAVEYVLMLSREEESQRQIRAQQDQVAEVGLLSLREEEQEDLLQFGLDEDGFERLPPSSPSHSSSFTRTSSSFTPTPIPSPRSYPRYSPVRSLSTSPTASRKIQVSPRPRNEAVEAGGLGMSPLDISRGSPSVSSVWEVPTQDDFPTMSSSSSPGPSSGRSSRRGMSAAMASWSSSSGDVRPSASFGGGSPRGVPSNDRVAPTESSFRGSAIPSSPKPLVTKRSWNTVARGINSSVSSPSSTPPLTSNVSSSINSARATPALSTSRSSLLTASMSRTFATDQPTSQEDEEAQLRYVLELSMKES